MANFYPFIMDIPSGKLPGNPSSADLFNPIRTTYIHGLDPAQMNMPLSSDPPQTPSFMDKFNSFFSDGGGLLGNDPQAYARNQGLLGMAAQLLQASGPSTTPTSLGQALGRGLQGYQQGQQGALKNISALNQQKLASNGVAPSSVREWQYFQTLTPAQQDQYLRVKRAQQFLNTGNQFVAPSPSNPTAVAPVAPINLKPGEQPAVKGAQAAAAEAGKAQADAQTNLGSTLDDINKMRDQVKGLVNAPGFNTIYGASGKFDPRNYLPGTDASNAAARRNQIDAMSFGISIQKMRGLGQLSDAEGKRVTSAFTRATNPNISADEARKAWGEVQTYLDLAEKRAKEKAGASQAQTPTAPKVRRYNPATGAFE